MDYKPGDIANGHVLGADMVWHPMEQQAPTPSTPVTQRATYWERYRSRWWKTALVLALVQGASAYSNGQISSGTAGLIDLLIGAVFGALITGSVINFVVAAFPARRSSQRPA